MKISNGNYCKKKQYINSDRFKMGGTEKGFVIDSFDC